ncbi:hypothetical protein BDR06DRAFT_419591 [Suillus hirtellus]|nr:hypothetical protein BDR06DRAFT_419591 [Suillus hirtellus]
MGRLVWCTSLSCHYFCAGDKSTRKNRNTDHWFKSGGGGKRRSRLHKVVSSSEYQIHSTYDGPEYHTETINHAHSPHSTAVDDLNHFYVLHTSAGQHLSTDLESTEGRHAYCLVGAGHELSVILSHAQDQTRSQHKHLQYLGDCPNARVNIASYG